MLVSNIKENVIYMQELPIGRTRDNVIGKQLDLFNVYE